MPDRHEVSVWCESREGPKAGGVVVVVLWGSMEAGLNTYIDSGVVFKACYTRLLRGLTQLQVSEKKGKRDSHAKSDMTCKFMAWHGNTLEE